MPEAYRALGSGLSGVFRPALALGRFPVDNQGVRPTRTSAAPLPVALLALSVAVCLSSAAPAAAAAQGSMGPGVPARSATDDQRDALENLLAALTDAARKLGQRLDHQALIDAVGPIETPSTQAIAHGFAVTDAPRPEPLRDALLNLPPPTSC